MNFIYKKSVEIIIIIIIIIWVAYRQNDAINKLIRMIMTLPFFTCPLFVPYCWTIYITPGKGGGGGDIRNEGPPNSISPGDS